MSLICSVKLTLEKLFLFLILKGLKIQTFGHLVIDGLHSDCRLDHGSKSRATYKS